MIEKLKKNSGSFFLTISVLILISLPFIWLPGNYLINSEEQLFMNYDILLKKSAYLWTSFSAYGLPATAANHSLIVPNAVFYSLLKYVGFSTAVTQKLFISASILLVCISFWKFATIITKKRHIILIGLLTYLLNFYVATSFTYTGKIFQLILTPLLFYLTYKYLETRKIYYIAIHFISVYILQAIFTNLTQLFALLPIYVFATIYFCIVNRKTILKQLRPLVIFCISTIPIYFYHGLIYYYSLYLNIESIKETTYFNEFFSNASRIFQFRGVWWEDGAGPNSRPYYAWSLFYNNQYIVMCSIIINAVVYYLLLLKNKLCKLGIFFTTIYCLYFSMATGLSMMPAIYPWLYKYFPFFYIFREPWPKFMPGVIFGFSAMLIIGLKKNYKQKYYWSFYFLLLVLILIRGYPFFSKDFYFQWRNDIAKVPYYWEQYRDWTADKEESVILPVPFFKKRGEFKYEWYHGSKGNTDIEMPFIFTESNAIRYYDDDIYSSIVKYSLDMHNFDFIKLAKTDFILLQNDVVSLNNTNWQRNEIFKYTKQKPVIKFQNKLTLYEIKNEYKQPEIFTTKHYSIVTRWQDIMRKNILQNHDPNSVIFSVFENVGKIKSLKNVKNTSNQEQIEYVKLNPTKYIVKLLNINDPFILVQEQTYNSNWKIRINTKETHYIDESFHFQTNGMLNSWLLTPKEICKIAICKKVATNGYNTEIIIEYTPQTFFDRLFKLNIILFSGFLFYLLIYIINIKWRHNAKNNLENLSK